MGSSNYITNIAGEVSQHTEYFAFGETFVEEHKGSNNSPYKFNGKELDAESGLYYYGARYYDPRISIWASVDPLADYNPVMNDEHYVDGEHNGGIENSFNHASYSYCYQSPVKYIDPNGKQNVAAALGGALLGGIIGGGIEATRQYLKYGSVRDWKMVGGSAAQGAIVGGVAGFTNGASLIVTATSAGAANAVGGTANRLINGEETTVSDIAIDFGTGFAIAGVFGKFSGLLKNSGFKEAGKYGFGSYSALRASILSKVGKGSGLEVHHLIEKRFTALFGDKTKDMVSMVLTKEEHAIFTKAWRSLIGYKGDKNEILNLTKDKVIEVAKTVYKDHPEILKALGIK